MKTYKDHNSSLYAKLSWDFISITAAKYLTKINSSHQKLELLQYVLQ